MMYGDGDWHWGLGHGHWGMGVLFWIVIILVIAALLKYLFSGRR